MSQENRERFQATSVVHMKTGLHCLSGHVFRQSKLLKQHKNQEKKYLKIEENQKGAFIQSEPVDEISEESKKDELEMRREMMRERNW